MNIPEYIGLIKPISEVNQTKWTEYLQHRRILFLPTCTTVTETHVKMLESKVKNKASTCL